MTYVITKNHIVYEFAPDNSPALFVQPPCTVRFVTMDVFAEQLVDGKISIAEIDRSRTHPATGPIYIERANVGSVISVKICDIRVEAIAVQGLVPGVGLLEINDWLTRRLPIEGEKILFGRFRLPIKPMIGVIGVAPPTKRIPCNWPGDHGGNIDTPEVSVGATVLLPVFVPGGLLAIGDVHALQADGEVCGMAAEVSATVELEIDVISQPDFPITCPWIFRGSQTIVVKSARTVEEAAKSAVMLMAKYLAHKYGLNFKEAYCLCSLIGNLRISQIVNPWITVKLIIDENLLLGN